MDLKKKCLGIIPSGSFTYILWQGYIIIFDTALRWNDYRDKYINQSNITCEDMLTQKAGESLINSGKELRTRNVYHRYLESCIKIVGCTNEKVRARQSLNGWDNLFRVSGNLLCVCNFTESMVLGSNNCLLPPLSGTLVSRSTFCWSSVCINNNRALLSRKLVSTKRTVRRKRKSHT